MIVKQILAMKSGPDHVETVSPGDPVSRAVEVMAQRRIGAVVVTTDGVTPEGILSERDIVRDLGRRGPACLDEPVDTLMTRNLVSCAPDDLADTVLERMTAGRFRHMPVMEGGKMIGIISIGDVVKSHIRAIKHEADAIKAYIAS